MTNTHSANVTCWLSEPLHCEVEKCIERLAAADDVEHVSIMPDVHLANDVCIGTVLATSNLIYPAAVGGDIGCGMAAIAFDAEADLLADEVAAALVLSGLYKRVSTNRHSAATMPSALPDDLETCRLSDARLDKLKRRDGRVQFGTLGRGNHFLEFQADAENRLWLMVHSGSRAMGQTITDYHVSLATASRSPGGLLWLDAKSESGRAYLHDVAWARNYARQNRLAMVAAVRELMSDLFGIASDESSLIHTDHNHVRSERHFGRQFWVHRKGAQSALVDEPGIIPGSMGTSSFHVAGRGYSDALYSSSHGAGRKMSRSDARRSIGRRRFHREVQAIWFDHRRADALRDEAPSAYKDIHAVMRAQKQLTRIVRELRPLLSYKGV